MIRKIRFKSIRTSMIIYFSCLVLLIVTAFMFFFHKIYQREPDGKLRREQPPVD